MVVTKVNVLVVEDLEIARKMAKIALDDLGCFVNFAENGEKALQLFKEHDYDIVFMDLGLPDIDGVTVVETIRKIEDNKKHVPIIALTANFDESYKKHCMSAGMDEFMLKPFTKEKGQVMIDKFVKKEGD